MALEYTRNISLEMFGTGAMTSVRIKRGDTLSRKIRVHLLHDGAGYTVPSGVNAECRCMDCTGDITWPDVSVSGEYVLITIDEDTANKRGRLLSDIVFSGNDGKQTSTSTFYIDIIDSPAADD